MAVRAKLFGTTTVAFVALVVLASTSLAGGGVHRYVDELNEQKVTIRANENRVLEVLFSSGSKKVKCDKGGGIAGGWGAKNLKITNGSFYVVRQTSQSELGDTSVVFRGRLKGDEIRGAVSVHFRASGTGAGFECWSGKGKGDPFVRYVATMR